MSAFATQTLDIRRHARYSHLLSRSRSTSRRFLLTRFLTSWSRFLDYRILCRRRHHRFRREGPHQRRHGWFCANSKEVHRRSRQTRKFGSTLHLHQPIRCWTFNSIPRDQRGEGRRHSRPRSFNSINLFQPSPTYRTYRTIVGCTPRFGRRSRTSQVGPFDSPLPYFRKRFVRRRIWRYHGSEWRVCRYSNR